MNRELLGTDPPSLAFYIFNVKPPLQRPDPMNFTLDRQRVSSVALALGHNESCCPLVYAAA